eukprot:4759867-Pyramimonas_sp.AAC.1
MACRLLLPSAATVSAPPPPASPAAVPVVGAAAAGLLVLHLLFPHVRRVCRPQRGRRERGALAAMGRRGAAEQAASGAHSSVVDDLRVVSSAESWRSWRQIHPVRPGAPLYSKTMEGQPKRARGLGVRTPISQMARSSRNRG